MRDVIGFGAIGEKMLFALPEQLSGLQDGIAPQADSLNALSKRVVSSVSPMGPSAAQI
ncbi:MAG: hypothetical protein P8P70_13595 [Sulfitobacter sp.]|nr:hypothetical protein [Sulfitobacter sp.]